MNEPKSSWIDRIGLLILVVVFAMRNGWISPDSLPIPIPIVPDDPAPFALEGNRCLIIEDRSERTKLTSDQLAVLTGGTVRQYLMQHCADGPDGSPEYRIWDVGQDLTYVPDEWRSVFDAAKSDPEFAPPWMVISNGKTGTTGPLPESPEAMVSQLRRFFE